MRILVACLVMLGCTPPAETPKPPPPAHLKHQHGMAQVLVRGLQKVTCVAMLAAIGANILQHVTALLA